jgi:hypothetical protein
MWLLTARQVSGFLSNRDSCVMRCTRANIDTDEFVTINVSVNHPRCPEKQGFVRYVTVWSCLQMADYNVPARKRSPLGTTFAGDRPARALKSQLCTSRTQRVCPF